MAIDFETLAPERCSECPVFLAAVTRSRSLIAQANRIIEGQFFDGETSTETAMRKSQDIEFHVMERLLSFLSMCSDSAEMDHRTLCRVPISQWIDIA